MLQAVTRLQAQKEELESRLLAQLPSDTVGNVERKLTPSRLARQLPGGTVMVDFVRYRVRSVASSLSPDNRQQARYLAFVVAHDAPITGIQLGDAESIERLAQQWREALLEGHDEPAAKELYLRVWEPVSRHFPHGTETVYLALDGGLSQVPWNALPMPDGQLLVERFAVATVPHGIFLLKSLLHAPRGTSSHGRVLAVGDVDFGRRRTPQADMPHGLKRLYWRPLAGSQKEIARLCAVAGSRERILLTGADATCESVMRELARCRWAHLATHGFFVDHSLRVAVQLAANLEDSGLLSQHTSRTSVLRRSPLVRSGLALARANEVIRDVAVPTGILTAEAITTVDCSGLELVVLSACETGRGDVVHGDGVFGIRSALHTAGARNVIASLWKIDDNVTAQLMSSFYRLLWKQGLTPLAALRRAQLELLRRSRFNASESRGPDLTHSVPLPHRSQPADAQVRHWAAFTLSGPGF
jgi:CHAT domain-containing protein